MEMLEKAKWIACDEGYAAPFVVKRFTAQTTQTAKISVFGLGYYELFVNGERISEDFFKPALSDYAKRDCTQFAYPTSDETTQRVYYNEYDVPVREGENTIVVLLGNGFFRQARRVCEGKTVFGDKLLLAYAVELKEKIVYTDGTEQCCDSFIVENNVFFGETHDYADWKERCFDGKNLRNVAPVTIVEPTGTLTKQLCPNERIERRVLPKKLFSENGKTVYDVGENITGFVSLRPLSQTVIVRHAEASDGEKLNYFSSGENQIQKAEYRNAVGRTVHPWFHWSGFRYFEIEGEADEIAVDIVHTPVEPRLKFRTGNETLNWLFEAYCRTQKSGFHGGITMDCPHRERLGYTGDGQLVAESAMLSLDCQSIFEKWMQDIADCQDINSGHIQHTAPFMGGGGGPGGWGSAIVLVPYAHYRLFGDKEILRKYFPNMRAWLSCMQSFCEDGLVVREREGGWCLGDWCTPQKVEIPEPLVNTFYYVRCMEIVSKIAEILDERTDYSACIQASKTAIERAYYNETSGEYCDNTQGANVFALLLGLGDARTKEKTLDKYRKTKQFDTGIFGTDLLCEWLVREGEIQLLFDLLTGEEFPSFGYMKKNGATTLWEGWRDEGSLSHPMMGGCVKQLVYGILGVKADIGFRTVDLQPKYIEGIGFVEAELTLPTGTLCVRYEYADGRVKQSITRK